MKLVIDIPEEDYSGICNLTANQLRMLPIEVAETLMLIKNGKPYEAEIGKIKSAISEVDFDFGDYYNHTDEIIEKTLSKIDEVMKNENTN